jgi:hypothetical protein
MAHSNVLTDLLGNITDRGIRVLLLLLYLMVLGGNDGRLGGRGIIQFYLPGVFFPIGWVIRSGLRELRGKDLHLVTGGSFLIVDDIVV